MWAPAPLASTTSEKRSLWPPASQSGPSRETKGTAAATAAGTLAPGKSAGAPVPLAVGAPVAVPVAQARAGESSSNQKDRRARMGRHEITDRRAPPIRSGGGQLGCRIAGQPAQNRGPDPGRRLAPLPTQDGSTGAGVDRRGDGDLPGRLHRLGRTRRTVVRRRRLRVGAGGHDVLRARRRDVWLRSDRRAVRDRRLAGDGGRGRWAGGAVLDVRSGLPGLSGGNAALARGVHLRHGAVQRLHVARPPRRDLRADVARSVSERRVLWRRPQLVWLARRHLRLSRQLRRAEVRDAPTAGGGAPGAGRRSEV